MPINTPIPEARLPVIGKFALGAPKPKDKKGSGLDLPHFRLRDASADVVAAVLDAYKPEPKMLRVMFTKPRMDDIIGGDNAWMRAYGSGMTKIKCDLSHIVAKRVKGRLVATNEPCQFDEKTHKCPLECKPDIFLTFLLHGVPPNGVFQIKTTSWINLDELRANLLSAERWTAMLDEKKFGLPPGTGTPNLIGVLFNLRKVPRQVNYTDADGTSHSSTKNLLSLEIDPAWMEMMLARLRLDAYSIEAPKSGPLQIAQPFDDDEEEDDEGFPPSPERPGLPHDEATELLASNSYADPLAPTKEQADKLAELIAIHKGIKEKATGKKAAEQVEPLHKLIDSTRELIKSAGLDYAIDDAATLTAALTNATAALDYLSGVFSPSESITSSASG